MPGATFANRRRRPLDVELRQHTPRSPCRATRGGSTAMTTSRSSVSAANATSWLCASTAISCCAAVGIALEQQVLERALQARHLLHEPLAAVLHGLALGLRHVIEHVHRARASRRSASRISGTVTLSDPGTRIATSPGWPAAPARAVSSMAGSLAEQLGVHHQRQQATPGHDQLRLGPAQHPQVLVARRNVQALQRLQELLSRRLLADAHAPRGVLGIAAACSRWRRTSR